MCFMYTSHSCGVKWKTYNFKEVKGVKTTKNCKTTNFARFFWWLSKGIELAPHPTVAETPNEQIFKRKLHSRWCYWECWKEQNDKKKFFFQKWNKCNWNFNVYIRFTTQSTALLNDWRCVLWILCVEPFPRKISHITFPWIYNLFGLRHRNCQVCELGSCMFGYFCASSINVPKCITLKL